MIELERKNRTITNDETVISRRDPILITGARGFIGSRVLNVLREYGFENLRCIVRPPLTKLTDMTGPGTQIQVIEGNLLSREDCLRAANGAAAIIHLAAGRGEKSFPDAFLNSVVTTRNLLDAVIAHRGLKRFVNVSSFVVYSNSKIGRHEFLDENCPMESKPALREEAYCYAKVKQDELLIEYRNRHKIPAVIVRPGVVYGPGNKGITGRVGVDMLGLFLHLGGSNQVPLTYVDNCADAIVRASVLKDIDGQVFNVVDSDLPSSRLMMKKYEEMYREATGRPLRSIRVPKIVSYSLCCLWEKYSAWSRNQLPPVFNRGRWMFYWKGEKYSNRKIRDVLGWEQRVPTPEAMNRYLAYQREVLRRHD